MITAAKLVVEVGADISGAEAGLKSMDAKLKSAAKNMAMAGAGLTAGFTLPILAAGKSIFDVGLSYESAFAGVTKTVSGTNAEMAALSDGIRDMAMNMPSSAESIASVAEAAGALGIPKDDILGFTQVMLDLSNTTNLSTDQAASDLARLANVTGMATDDFDRLGSAIVATGNAGASTEQEIVGMATRLASAFSTVGVSEADIIGWASAFASLGLEAEAGGTAGSRVMIDMAQAVALGTKKLDKFADVAGMSSEAFSELFNEDASAALLAFVGGLGEIDAAGGNLFQTLEELEFSDVRVRDTLLRLAGANDLVTDSLATSNKAWEENVALSKEAGIRYKTGESQLNILRNRFRNLGITISEVAKGSMAPMLEGLNDFVLNLNEGISAIADSNPQLINMALGFAAVAAAIGPVLLVVSAVAAALASPFIVPVTAAIGAVALLAAAWSTNFGDIQAKTANAVTAVQNFGTAVGAAFALFSEEVTGKPMALEAQLEAYRTAVDYFGPDTVNKLIEIGEGIHTFALALKSAYDIFSLSATGDKQSLSRQMRDFENIKAVFGPETYTNLRNAGDAIHTFAQGIKSAYDIFSTLATGGKQPFGEQMQDWQNVTEAFGPEAYGRLTNAATAILSFAQAVKSAYDLFASSATGNEQSFGKQMQDWQNVTEMFGPDAYTNLTNAGTAILTFAQALKSANDLFTSAATGNKQSFGDQMEDWERVTAVFGPDAYTKLTGAGTAILSFAQALKSANDLFFSAATGNEQSFGKQMQDWQTVTEVFGPDAYTNLTNAGTAILAFAQGIKAASDLFAEASTGKEQSFAKQMEDWQRVTEAFGPDTYVNIVNAGNAIRDFATGISTAFDNVTFPSLDELMAQFKTGGLPALIAEVKTTAVELMINLDTELNITGRATELGNTLIGIVTGIGDAIRTLDVTGTAISGLQTLITDALNFSTAFTNALNPKMIAAAMATFVQGFAGQMTAAFAPDKLGDLGTALGGLSSAITGKLTEILAAPEFGADVGLAIGKAVGAMAEGAAAFVSGMVGEISTTDWTKFQGSIDTFILGFTEGVVTGIGTADWGDVGTAIKDGIAKAIELSIAELGKKNIFDLLGGAAGGALGAGAKLVGMPTLSETFKWPPIPEGLFAWPSIPEGLFTWPSIPEGLFTWPDIPVPDWVQSLINALSGGISGAGSLFPGGAAGANTQDFLEDESRIGGSKGRQSLRPPTTQQATQEPLVWRDYIPDNLLWPTFIPQPLEWQMFAKPLEWLQFVRRIEWQAFVQPIAWSSFVPSIDWNAFVERLSWGSYVTDLSWGNYVVDLSWGNYVPPLNWGDFVPGYNQGGQDPVQTEEVKKTSVVDEVIASSITVNIANVSSDMDVHSAAAALAREFRRRVR